MVRLKQTMIDHNDHTEQRLEPLGGEVPAPADDGEILGLDNVRLELPLAGAGSRALAITVDMLCVMILGLLWLAAGGVVSGFLGLGSGWVIALLMIGSFLLQWSYFAGFEIATEGQTPGKRVVGLRVTSGHGGRASVAAIVVRNLLRSIDMLIGVPLMLFDRRSRRLGDLVAGTVVVHHRPVVESELAPLGSIPDGWSPREVALAESFLRRVESLEPRRAQRFAARILRLALPDPAVDEAAEPPSDAVAALKTLLGPS